MVIGLAGGYYFAETSFQSNTLKSENKFALEKRGKNPADANNTEVNEKIIKKAKQEVLSEIKDIENQIPTIEEDTTSISGIPPKNNESNNDSNVNIVFQNDEEIVIRQEKLLHTATSYIYKIVDSNGEPEAKSDSNSQALLEKNADIKQASVKEHSIEFWETPLNYKGYKYGNYKLIVYGLEPNDFAVLIQQNSSLYFRYKSDYYLIKQTNTFTPLKKVNVDFNDSYLEKL